MNKSAKLNSAARNALILGLLFFLSGMAYADSCTDWVAKLDSFQGKVQTKRANSVDWKQVGARDSFCAGDMLRVMEKSRAVIALKNDTVMRLDQNTTITLAAGDQSKPSLLDLLKGAAYFISRTPQKFRVNTPFLNAGIEGTEFLVSVQEREAAVSVFEGAVLAENSFGSLMLAAGQTATAEAGKAPVLKVVARPKDAVQWTLYYPQIASAGEAGWQKEASELLAVGRVDEAGLVLDRVLKQESANSSALALQAVMAIARNDREKARDLASRAVASSPNSASAHLALSYAQQAAFDLKGALSSVRTATEKEPANALAWARLSELHLSLGEKKESLAASDKAVSLAPDLSRTRTVSGFAHLSHMRPEDAMTSFEKAASLDPADPLPRLGLGLAKIRKGQLEDGRREIEIAVSLDTNNALIRSYLGKAYYEEKRDSVAADQFSMAKEADPKDPTAFFYSALQKQSENRPVEALQDLEKSMELNDNRAVYRSRLLLDEDQAARGASLARIYDDLGFQQLALSEGFKSVNVDPANASAHRFLSDSYAALPRHEIARVSELLQAQLLQPVGHNPVQPYAAESKLFILNGAGPADVSFNEFNPLFDRNRISLQLSGVVGSNDTFGDEVVVAALHDNVSLSAGQFHYRTDGVRRNNDLRQDIYNLFGQYGISRDTSIQAEFRSTDKVFGDLSLNFFPDFSESLRQKDRYWSIRLGGHHSFSSQSDLLASFTYRQDSKNTHIGLMPTLGIASFDNIWDVNSTSAELQHIYHKTPFKLITGTGYFHIDHNESTDIGLIDPPLSFWNSIGDNIDHTNLYAYALINKPASLTFTIGSSVDFFHDIDFSRKQFNPKLGAIWTPLPETTVRAAAFRTLERTLITGQTLEPTSVAGFNQFFDDSTGASAWNYGIGIDQKFSNSIFGGIEYRLREIKVPWKAVDGLTGEMSVEIANWDERAVRGYAYWTPHKMLALRAEYYYETFKRDKEFSAGVERVRTNRLPLGISFFDPHGFGAKLQATYVNQKGAFVAQESLNGESASGSNHFWLLDAGVSYRLPLRRGIISLEGKNLFNKSFQYQDMDPVSPAVQPKRSVFLKITLAI